jgi:hypothetical protein
MAPFCASGAYINYQSEEDHDVVAAAFAGNRARLLDVKRRYDPQNVFRSNQNLLPPPWSEPGQENLQDHRAARP